MKKQIAKYLEEIKDPNSKLYAGSAIFLVSYIQLCNISRGNPLLANKMNHYISFAYDMIEKDGDYFSLDNEVNKYKLMDMVDNYVHFAAYIEGVSNHFNQCKECCTNVVDDYPVLTYSARSLKSIVSNTCRNIDYDIFEAYEKDDPVADYPYQANEVLEYSLSLDEANELIAQTISALLIKLVKRRMAVGNKKNLPLEETLALSEKLFENQNLPKPDYAKLLENISEIFNNTKSSVKMDYFYAKNILTFMEAYLDD